MYRIDVKDYSRVRPIFAELDIHLNVTAVLDGNSAGEIFVDDVAHPRTAYMTSSDGHYLAGNTDNRAFNAALNAALPRDRYFVLFCNLEWWERALDVVLKHTYAVRARRRYHTLERLTLADWQARIPAGLSLQRIEGALLAKELKNRDDVVEGVLEEWRSLDGFLQTGFGFCLVREHDIVSWSFSDYVSGARTEIGVQTDWAYRRQGFGTLTAAATAAHAVSQGFSTIGWHCWDNNIGSIGVAENLGFKKAAEYDVFINHWAAENITDMSQAEFRSFAESYEREFKIQPPTSGFPHVVAAKAWALSGDRDGCFRQLDQAVDIGWLRSVEHLREIWPEFFFDPDLDQRQEWQALVKRIEG